MESNELRKKFLDFFASRDHAVVPSSSLIPDDSSVLLTTAGMQQFKPYYTGEVDPMATVHPNLGKPLGSNNAASIQKSFRTSDIDEVGDERHLTFFEMMGNFSFGGYFKEEAIRYAFDFLTSEVGLKIEYVTVFEGLDSIGVPEDTDSQEIWHSLDPNIKIIKQGIDDVFWGPTGSSGPCGPTTEIYIKNGAGEAIEVWNIVFNEFFFPGSREELLSGASGKKLERLPTPGVDTGMGLERLAMCSQKTKTVFETDLFEPILSSIIEIQGDKPIKEIRLIADHLRAATFLIADGIEPGRDERNYIPRRLMRRAMSAHYLYIGAGLDINFFRNPVNTIIDIYVESYPGLKEKKGYIMSTFEQETTKFSKILLGTINDLKKIYNRFITRIDPEKKLSNLRVENNILDIDGRVLFKIRETYGVGLEIMKMVMEKWGARFGEKTSTQYNQEYYKHQETSRAGAEAKFGGHGLYMKTGEVTIRDESEVERVTRLHTATHLLHAGLRAALGPEVRQDGSDITAERTRFDFRFPRKVAPEELKEVEQWVNAAIRSDLAVQWEEMPYAKAIEKGALGFFREKYPPRVKVYSVFDQKTGEVVSCELCGGPHVSHTGEIGTFTIIKEESSSAGVRRIRAVVK